MSGFRLGPAQHVGSSATSGHVVRKRAGEHAAALAAVLAVGDVRDVRPPGATTRDADAVQG